jgi:hypothetical protein
MKTHPPALLILKISQKTPDRLSGGYFENEIPTQYQ